MLDYEKTGTLIQELRHRRGLTQKELADILGVTDRAVSKWENGKAFPDVSMLKPLASELCISVGELLDGQLRTCGETITPEEAGDTAIRAIRVYARQNMQRHRVLLCILGLLLVLLFAVGVYEYYQYCSQPLDFKNDDLTFGAVIFHEEDGTEYRWELDDAAGQELREQITYYLKKEMPQGTSMYGSYYMIDSSRQRAWVELENLMIFYDSGYYDFKSDDCYTFNWISNAHRIMVDLCRELVEDETYEYTGERHFQDGEQTLDINCELTDVRMELVVKYLEAEVLEPERSDRPGLWTNFTVNKITRLLPEQYEAQEEFEWLYKEIVYHDLTSWRIYDVELVTEYIGEYGPWIPQYPDGECHLLFMAARDKNSDLCNGETFDHVIWYYYPEY